VDKTYKIVEMYISFSCGALTRLRAVASPNEVSRSHALDTRHSVGLLCASDQPDTDTIQSYTEWSKSLSAPHDCIV